MNKKFISWVSAVALASSVIVVPLSANAEGETVLWSDTFNAYENLTAHYTNAELVGDVLLDGTLTAKSEYNGIGGVTLISTDRADDSSYFQIKENEGDAADKYLTTTVSRFSNANRGASIKFNETYTSDKDLVLASKVMFHNEGGTTYDNAFRVGSTVINMDTIGVPADEWHDIKVVINSSGTSVYLDDNTATAVATGSDVSLSEIKFVGTVDGVDDSSSSGAQKSTAHPIGYPTFAFNDMVVYTAENGAESDVPKAADQVEATPTPTPQPAAEITNTVTYDFESADTTPVYTTGRSMTAEVAADATNGTNVLKITSSATCTTGATDTAAIDLSSVTTGKSHIIVDYDILIGSAGRMSAAVLDTALAAYGDAGFFRQGLTGTNSFTNAVGDTWIHTNVDIDMDRGSVTYKVTNGDQIIIERTADTKLKAVNNISFAAWGQAEATVSIDNIVIQTGGSMDLAVTPEPAAEVEGSEIDLLPASDVATEFEFNAIEDAEETVLNHSKAKAAKAGTIDTYDADKARGNSIYTSFDLLVNVGDKFTLESYGTSDLGATYVFEGLSDGTLSIYGIQNKSDKADYKVDLGSGACGTWYRVSIEVPQNNNEGVTNTGASKVKVSRIDPTDCTKTTDVIAQGEVGPRNIAEKGMAKFNATVSGKPYIDNGVVYLAAQSTGGDTPDPTVATPEPAGTAAGSDVTLVPENARETIGTFEAAEGEAAAITNHANAKKAVTTTATAINAYSEKARGNAIYAAYDVYVTIGSKIAVTPYGDSGKALGSSIILEGLENGTIKMSIPKDSNTTVDVPNDLVHDTWYRVVMEIPQKGTSDKTYAEDMKYSVYRIDSADPTKTTLAVSADAYGRGLAGDSAKAMSSIGVEVTGDVYIDNGVVYLSQTAEQIAAHTWYRYHFDKTGEKVISQIEIIPEADLSKKADKLGQDYYIWNGLMQPYVKAAEDTPAE